MMMLSYRELNTPKPKSLWRIFIDGLRLFVLEAQ